MPDRARTLRNPSAFLGLLTALFLWFLATHFSLISPLFLPGPGVVAIEALRGISTGSLVSDATATSLRWIAGFLLGASLGLIAGTGMGLSKRLYAPLELPLEVLRAVPIVSILPLFLVLFGIGDRSKIAASAWAAFLYTLLNTVYGVRHARTVRLELARCYGATRWQTVRHVVIPDALPTLVAGLRIALSMSLVVVVATEMLLGTHSGLGRRIYDAVSVFDMPRAYAHVLASGILGYGANMIGVVAEKHLIHWRGH